MAAFGRPQGLLGRLGGRIMAHANREMNRRVVGLLAIREGESVLDVGCGPGVGIGLLASSTTARRVVGVDPSDEMIVQASERNRAAIRSGVVELSAAPADRLPFADATFDAAMSINSMQVWPDAISGLREIRRVLRPGGRIALGFSGAAAVPEAVPASSLQGAGFEDVRREQQGGVVCFLAITPLRANEEGSGHRSSAPLPS